MEGAVKGAVAAGEAAGQPQAGGALLADVLIAQGVDVVFGVPGESFLAVLDAFHDRASRLRFVTCRNEGGAAFMADAHAKLTGRPGICLVTRGPGACNASIGVHTAFQDSTPMVLLIGQVPRHFREREAFQEVEFRQMFAPLAKWVCEIDSADRLPEHLSRAFHVAQSGRPGPVVVVLPEDVLSEATSAVPLPAARPARPAPEAAAMARCGDLLRRAERPLMILGGPDYSNTAKALAENVAAQARIPVITALRCQDYFDNAHPCYAGDLGISANPAVVQRVRDADVLLVVGARLGEMTTQGYEVPSPPAPGQTLIHVHPSADELGRVYFPELAVQSSTAIFLQALAQQDPGEVERRSGWLEAARKSYEDGLVPQAQPGALDFGQFMGALRSRLPEDAIITNGAGNYTAWIHKFWQFRKFRTQLAPTSGAMGYGLPAAVAAKLEHPDRRVVAFAGDGCLQMNQQELATVAQFGLDPMVIVVNNGMLGTIRMHQEREYPGRVSATALHNPDFCALARAYGFHAEALRASADIEGVLDRALGAPGAALIECVVDAEAITPRMTLTALRQRSRGQ